jgi:hypothetical protein
MHKVFEDQYLVSICVVSICSCYGLDSKYNLLDVAGLGRLRRFEIKAQCAESVHTFLKREVFEEEILSKQALKSRYVHNLINLQYYLAKSP